LSSYQTFQFFLDSRPHIRPSASQGCLASPCGDVALNQGAVHPGDCDNLIPQIGCRLGKKSLCFP
jgi:hypothetical protein